MRIFSRYVLMLLSSIALIEPVFFGMAQNIEFVCKASVEGNIVRMNKICLQQDMYPKINDKDVAKMVVIVKMSDVVVVNENGNHSMKVMMKK